MIRPAIGILMLDTTFPRIPGDVGNPATFSFPVIYRVVKGASPRRVVEETDPRLLDPFIQAGRDLQKAGVKAIATSCGFLALFQRELADALSVPVFSSSLLQVPLVRAILPSDRAVGIITARKASLTARHLAGVGVENEGLVIAGMEGAEELSAVFFGGKSTIDVEKVRGEMVDLSLNLVRSRPEVGAIVLECANMPPYARDVRRATGLPVFDVATLLEQACAALTDPRRWDADPSIQPASRGR